MLDPDVIKLAEELDGLPLALATAGAYLDQTALSFSDYLRLYRAWAKLLKTSPELSSYEDRTLYSTWQLSFDHVKQRNELSLQNSGRRLHTVFGRYPLYITLRAFCQNWIQMSNYSSPYQTGNLMRLLFYCCLLLLQYLCYITLAQEVFQETSTSNSEKDKPI